PREGEQLFAGDGVPEAHRVVPAGGQPPAVGAEARRGDGRGVSLQGEESPTGGRVPNPEPGTETAPCPALAPPAPAPTHQPAAGAQRVTPPGGRGGCGARPAETGCPPPGPKAWPVPGAWCPRRTRPSGRRDPSHTFTVRSRPALARCVPSGLTATAVTVSAC